ncbi:hypothetical protein CPC08DRAFT_748943 [Agrocybe pediades]|nr:hypothetical protein CPC08DRAFT_748943 [Agrocybe pediades]
MHSNFLTTVLVAVVVAKGVLSVPLGLSHPEAKTQEEKDNLASLQAAANEANRQIPIMEKVLADPNNEKHKPLIEAAFGKNVDLKKVKENVQKLKTGTVPVHLPTAPGSDTIAYNRYDKDKPPMKSVHIEFGKKYHKSAESTRTGTLIHEATHYLGNTGDYIEKGKMLKGNQHETEHMGYTSKSSFYKTPKSLNGDKTWTTMRDSTQNMHDNAEAYGQFASLCANAKLTRRDFHNFRRALATGDDDAAISFLARRNACALPKDYFKKKAAAKAAIVAKKPHAPAKNTHSRTPSSQHKLPASKPLKNALKVGKHVPSRKSTPRKAVGAKHVSNKLRGGRPPTAKQGKAPAHKKSVTHKPVANRKKVASAARPIHKAVPQKSVVGRKPATKKGRRDLEYED